MKTMELSECQFYDKYKLEKNHLVTNASFDGCMFETFGEEIKYVISKVKTNQVWTIIECEGDWIVSAGYHLVNRIGYLITSQPWEDDNEFFIDVF